ncbi:hypothetical protein LZ30DRAFT_366456 [Colletotrichum cereale]|nr:hypothetical protein LZ30DRAFT_366456 [Colletotrichum cereale]
MRMLAAPGFLESQGRAACVIFTCIDAATPPLLAECDEERTRVSEAPSFAFAKTLDCSSTTYGKVKPLGHVPSQARDCNVLQGVVGVLESRVLHSDFTVAAKRRFIKFVRKRRHGSPYFKIVIVVARRMLMVVAYYRSRGIAMVHGEGAPTTHHFTMPKQTSKTHTVVMWPADPGCRPYREMPGHSAVSPAPRLPRLHRIACLNGYDGRHYRMAWPLRACRWDGWALSRRTNSARTVELHRRTRHPPLLWR